ncbi:zinc-binding dehydrogenase [Micromonosporaceae bacterium Da 78-11]
MENTMMGVEAFGQPLAELRRPVPVAGPGEALIEVDAAAVNPADLGMVAGRYRWVTPVRFPLVPGYDVAGRRVDTGAPVVAFTMHKATQRGGYARFVTLPEDLVVPLPDGFGPADAVTLPLAGLTALQALDEIGADTRTLLVNGPHGAIGGFLTDLATARGITVVPVEDPVRVDAAIDVVGGAAARAAFDRVADGGRYVTVVPEFWVPGGPFTGERDITPRIVAVRYDRGRLSDLVRLAAAGTVRTRVGKVLPLAGAAEAHRIVARSPGAPRIRGKVVLTPRSPG